MCSWFLCLSYLTIVFLNATALFVVTRTLYGDFLQIGYHYQVAGYEVYTGEVAISIAALVIIGILFIIRKPLLQRIHTVLSLILIVSAVIIAAAGFSHLHMDQLAHSFGTNGLHPTIAILTVVLLAPWAFVGFDVISLETAHYRFSIKKSPRIIMLSILCGGFVYAALAVVSVTVTPEGYSSWQQYMEQLDSFSGVAAIPTFLAAFSHLGTSGLIIAAISAIAAILTGIIGAYRATTRVLSTMAEDRILSPKFLTTSFCIIFIMGISILISFLGSNALNWFVELTTFGAIVGFGYTSAAARKLAGQESNRTAQITGTIGTVVSVLFVIVQLISRFASIETMSAPSFLLLAIWCLIGFLFYWRTMRFSVIAEYNGVSTTSTVLFLLLLYSAVMWFAKSLLNASDIAQIRSMLIRNSVILVLFIIFGLGIMLYIQYLMRKRHAELEREKIHAEESSRAKSQFLFNMSHDIRTPMNAIIGYTHLAAEEKDIPPKVREYVEKIDVSSKHLLALINDVLEMSQIENGKMNLISENADLCETVRSAYDLFVKQMEEKQIDYSLNMNNVSNRWVIFDRNRLTRVLLNLISNAYKFTPSGGNVSVTLLQVGAPGTQSVGFELHVKDSGIGMTKEFVKNVFEAFSQERSSTISGIQGTGLGMAITKNIVDLMGGLIEVDTVPGQGTEFIVHVTFPLGEEIEQPPEEHAAMQADFTGMRALLAEDMAINRELAAMLLGNIGFEVEFAENGQEAVEKVSAAENGYYDVILMDIQMPVMDGYEATRRIRALSDAGKAALPVIAMTANAFIEDKQNAASAGMDGHITKPVDINQMIRTLADILHPERSKNPETH